MPSVLGVLKQNSSMASVFFSSHAGTSNNNLWPCASKIVHLLIIIIVHAQVRPLQWDCLFLITTHSQKAWGTGFYHFCITEVLLATTVWKTKLKTIATKMLRKGVYNYAPILVSYHSPSPLFLFGFFHQICWCQMLMSSVWIISGLTTGQAWKRNVLTMREETSKCPWQYLADW